MISYSFATAIGLLIAISFGLLGYHIGRQHGFDEGHVAGANVERGRTMRRVICAKLQAFHEGVHVGIRRTISRN